MEQQENKKEKNGSWIKAIATAFLAVVVVLLIYGMIRAATGTNTSYKQYSNLEIEKTGDVALADQAESFMISYAWEQDSVYNYEFFWANPDENCTVDVAENTITYNYSDGMNSKTVTVEDSFIINTNGNEYESNNFMFTIEGYDADGSIFEIECQTDTWEAANLNIAKDNAVIVTTYSKNKDDKYTVDAEYLFQSCNIDYAENYLNARDSATGKLLLSVSENGDYASYDLYNTSPSIHTDSVVKLYWSDKDRHKNKLLVQYD